MVFLNGHFLPDHEAKVSVFDRAFLYGDGLFETVRVHRQRLFRWPQHYQRLTEGAAALGIQVPFGAAELAVAATRLVMDSGLEEALLRVNLSRGVGGRAYLPSGANHPVTVMTLRSMPPVPAKAPVRWRVITSSLRVPAADPLARIKTCSKVHHVMARAEAETKGADEALLFNTGGLAAEGTGSNLFWIEGQSVRTPPLSCSVLAGITRNIVMGLCNGLGIPVEERACSLQTAAASDGIFLTLSSFGVVEVESLDGRPLPQSAITLRLYAAYQELLEAETRF